MTLKHCGGCGENKELSEFYFYHSGNLVGKLSTQCKKCTGIRSAKWKISHPERARENARNYIYRRGSKPASENKSCTVYLGCVIAETILSREFPGFVRMPNGNPGYDYDCPKGSKIDVKSSCRRHLKKGGTRWEFRINKNKVPNYFLFLAFGDRNEPLVPEHIWLIPGAMINTKTGIAIYDLPKSIDKWSQYERPLDNVIECCNQLRGEN